MTVLFKSFAGFGDSIMLTPMARFFHKQGHEVLFFHKKLLLPAFEKISWMKVEEVGLFDQYIKNATKKDIIVMPGWDHKIETEAQFFSFDHKYSNYYVDMGNIPQCKNEALKFIYSSTLPIHKKWLMRIGIETTDFQTEIGFEHQDTNIPKNTILINFGSPSASKHLHPQLAISLKNELEKLNYSVILLQGPNDIGSKHISLTPHHCNNFHEILKEYNINTIPMNLVNYLNLIRECKIFISPDGGLLHAAIAMKHPLIYLETYYPQNLLFTTYDQCITIKPEQRYKKCNSCTLRDYICDINEYSVGCLTNCDIQPIIAAVKQLS